MTYDNILFENRDGVATITLNRPDKLNAYIPQMGAEIVGAFEEARNDDSVRAVILTGTGKAFCAGVDLDYIKGVTSGEIVPEGPRLGEESFVRQWPLDALEFPKPIIAAVNGAAVGVGITMILPCDIRIAAVGAKLKLNFTRLGMLPGLGSTGLLPQLVGVGRALDLVLTGETVLAESAAEVGLVQQVVPADQLIATARQRAEAIAKSRPEVITAAKRLLRTGARDLAAAAMKREQSESAGLRKGR